MRLAQGRGVSKCQDYNSTLGKCASEANLLGHCAQRDSHQALRGLTPSGVLAPFSFLSRVGAESPPSPCLYVHVPGKLPISAWKLYVPDV